MSAFSVLDHLEAQLAPSGIQPRGVVSVGAPAASSFLETSAARSGRHFPLAPAAFRTGSARCLVEGSHRPRRRNAWGGGVLSLRSALHAFPAMGDAGGGADRVSARHPHSSRLRSLARISGRAGIFRSDRRGSCETVSIALCHRCGQALPVVVPGRRGVGNRLRSRTLPRASGHCRWACGVHGVGMYRTQCLSGWRALPLFR